MTVPADTVGVVVGSGTCGACTSVLARFCNKATWEIHNGGDAIRAKKAVSGEVDGAPSPEVAPNKQPSGPFSDVAVLKYKQGENPELDRQIQKIVGKILQSHSRKPRELLPELIMVMDKENNIEADGYPGDWPHGVAGRVRQGELKLHRVLWEDIFSTWSRPPGYRYPGLQEEQSGRVPSNAKSFEELSWGYATDRSTRAYQEDRWNATLDFDIFHKRSTGRQSYFAVYDGHHGAKAAEYCVQHLHENIARYINDVGVTEAIRRGYKHTDEAWGEHSKRFVGTDDQLDDGTCSTSIIVSPSQNRLYCGYVGDCWACLSRGGKAVPLTENAHHGRCPKERARIEEEGGWVDASEDARVNGDLCVSRSIGDYIVDTDGNWTKPKGLSSTADTWEQQLQDDDEFLIVASDGLWDKMDYKYVVQTARRSLKRWNDPQRTADRLTSMALKLQTTDNITVVVVTFNYLKHRRKGGV